VSRKARRETLMRKYDETASDFFWNCAECGQDNEYDFVTCQNEYCPGCIFTQVEFVETPLVPAPLKYAVHYWRSGTSTNSARRLAAAIAIWLCWHLENTGWTAIIRPEVDL
jgi:hypothetical protein